MINQLKRQVVSSIIRKKLIGKRLNYREIFALMDELAHPRLDDILTTYYTAAGFTQGFGQEELYYLTKAMVATGDKLSFKGVVADKHSTGGMVGTRTSMIIVPIVAAAGVKIPKNSSRAITSPSGTADTMEVLASVTFSPKQIHKIVEEVGGCIVWGGHLGLAPADDMIIRVEEPLGFESIDKMILSIMAKKIASGITHLVLDLPIGPNMKIRHMKEAEVVKKKFEYLGKRFKIKMTVDINKTLQPTGCGVGPVLEARDVLQILEQKRNRSFTLERKSVRLAIQLLTLCFKDLPKRSDSKDPESLVMSLLSSGKALTKFREIIHAQGGDRNVSTESLALAHNILDVKSSKSGQIVMLSNRNVSVLAKILGSPNDKKAGIFLMHKLEEKVDKGDILCTFYSSDKWRLNEALKTLLYLPIYKIE